MGPAVRATLPPCLALPHSLGLKAHRRRDFPSDLISGPAGSGVGKLLCKYLLPFLLHCPFSFPGLAQSRDASDKPAWRLQGGVHTWVCAARAHDVSVSWLFACLCGHVFGHKGWNISALCNR